jgi:hypothetical protein
VPEIKSKANRKDGIQYDQKQGYQNYEWIGKQDDHNERKAQVLEKNHDSIKRFRVGLQGKKDPEELRSGEEESGDNHKLEDTSVVRPTLLYIC